LTEKVWPPLLYTYKYMDRVQSDRLLLKPSYSNRSLWVHWTHYKVGHIQDHNTLLLLWACLIDVVFLTATGNQRRILVTRGGQTCYVVWWNILCNICYSYFVIQRFGAVAVSQASSTVTDGINWYPTFDTRLIVTLLHLVCEGA
jgi:hypothetical protein